MTTILDSYDTEEEFEDALNAAECSANNAWEIEFAGDLRERFDKYGEGMYLSERQQQILDRIANGD